MLEPTPTTGDTSWLVHDRFEMFIQWGLYALPSRHEWVQSFEKTAPDDYYERYFTRFNPHKVDPRQWAISAREAGMNYVVLTAKYHEGFCLWDSAHTDSRSQTPPTAKIC